MEATDLNLLTYVVTCDHPMFTGTSYQCGEPEFMGHKQGVDSNEWSGGFTLNIIEATLYKNFKSAQKVCDRMAKIYSHFKIRVLSKSAKELFLARLVG